MSKAFGLAFWKDSFWEHKQAFAGVTAVLYALAFGLVGYCVGSVHGFRAELFFGATLGLSGAIFGYCFGIAMAYSSQAVSSTRTKFIAWIRSNSSRNS